MLLFKRVVFKNDNDKKRQNYIFPKLLFFNDLKKCKSNIFKSVSILCNNECLALNGSPRIGIIIINWTRQKRCFTITIGTYNTSGSNDILMVSVNGFY